MKTIATVVGARPQFIKASPVSRALREAGISETIIHTGQHSDAKMSDIFFDEMEIPKPDHFLGVSGLPHGAMTGEMLKKIEDVLIQNKPDALLVYGDTNSTLAGALAAAKLQIPVAHVEAGLRSYNMRMPEEINRALTDRVSKWLFCPSPTSVKNLGSEGFREPDFRIENVGDVMLDATQYFKKKARWPAELPKPLLNSQFVLCTLHRQKSIDDPEVFAELLDTLALIARETPIVWPVHPRARKAISSSHRKIPGLHLIEPVGYLEMLALLEACSIVATDSGGLQKEAYFANKYCLTLRTETEWIELVHAGVNIICGNKRDSILGAFRADRPPFIATNLYGDGRASIAIAKILSNEV